MVKHYMVHFIIITPHDVFYITLTRGVRTAVPSNLLKIYERFGCALAAFLLLFPL